MKVGDLLKTKTTTLRDVLSGPVDSDTMTITSDAVLCEAARRITANPIGALAVVDEVGAVIGIVTEKDIVRVISEHGAEAVHHSVASVMTPNPTCRTPDETTRDALLKMIRGRHRHMPVVEDGVLLGLVMSLDVANARLSETTTQSSAMNKLVAVLMAGRGECTPDEDIEVALERMSAQDIHCLPVRKDEKVLGVVTSCDVLKVKLGSSLTKSSDA